MCWLSGMAQVQWAVSTTAKCFTKQFYCIQTLTQCGLYIFLNLRPRGAE